MIDRVGVAPVMIPEVDLILLESSSIFCYASPIFAFCNSNAAELYSNFRLPVQGIAYFRFETLWQ